MVTTRLGAALRAVGARQEFLRAFWDGRTATPTVVQDSGALRALAASNALIVRTPGSGPAVVGDEVSIYLLGTGGMA
jgi:molybdopterin molybdotransferase